MKSKFPLINQDSQIVPEISTGNLQVLRMICNPTKMADIYDGEIKKPDHARPIFHKSSS